ncbi:Uma2 family endonuclease [Spirosoma luteum]|uniref:Uma2 family endonuclease n=1 Tax=Spirosoma luteum TaxID=431553 RepID=UPI0003799B1E|nr:Uma2 family endonuclease [Spirosoma luteum]
MKLPTHDLVIKVLSKGTAKRDPGVRFTDYAANGIAGYWIIRPGKKTVEQYELDPDLEEYTALGTFSQQEEIESKQVAGYRISVLALFDEEAIMKAHRSLFL